MSGPDSHPSARFKTNSDLVHSTYFLSLGSQHTMMSAIVFGGIIVQPTLQIITLLFEKITLRID